MYFIQEVRFVARGCLCVFCNFSRLSNKFLNSKQLVEPRFWLLFGRYLLLSPWISWLDFSCFYPVPLTKFWDCVSNLVTTASFNVLSDSFISHESSSYPMICRHSGLLTALSSICKWICNLWNWLANFQGTLYGYHAMPFLFNAVLTELSRKFKTSKNNLLLSHIILFLFQKLNFI